MDLKERVRGLCKRKRVTAQQAEIDLGLAKGYISKLNISTPNAINMQKMAEYFNVTLEYLLTGSETEEAPTRPDEREISFDDFTYAMHNETKNLPQDKKDMLLQMARFMAKEEEEKKKNGG